MRPYPGVILLLAVALPAQVPCGLTTAPTGIGVPSLDWSASQLAEWDPDGPGPLGRHLVVGGAFHLAGDRPADGLALWDPATNQWSALGHLDGQVSAFAVLPNGLLLAAGSFAAPPFGWSALQVWTGSAWSDAIPQPVGRPVRDLAVAPNGDVFAACWSALGFTVQRFDSAGWQTIGTFAAASPTGFALVATMAIDANGDLLVGGSFDSVAGVAANNLARWNGSAWSALGSGVIGEVDEILVTSTGNIFVGGFFALGGPGQFVNVAQWTGSSWQPLGAGTWGTVFPEYARVQALAEVPGGIVVGGGFDLAGGQSALKVAFWNGSTWSAMGSGIEVRGPNGLPSAVLALQRTTNGDLYAAGNFGTISGRDGAGLARWNGVDWRPLRSQGIGNVATAVHRTIAGDVYLGGEFQDIDGVVHRRIAKRAGTGWQPLGSGLGAAFVGPTVTSIRSFATGEVVVGGRFPTAGGAPIAGLAVWNGTSWGPLGGGLSAPFGLPRVEALHFAANGDLYVAGNYGGAGGVPVESLARWNGSQWSAVGQGLAAALGVAPSEVSLSAVTTTAVGEVYVAADVIVGTAPASRVARFTAGVWQVIGESDATLNDLVEWTNGDLLAAGSFQSIDGVPVGCVARWSGGAWSSFGGLALGTPGGTVRRVSVLPSGALLAAGSIGLAGGSACFARWDGVAWTLFENGFAFASDLSIDPDGEVLAAGRFSSVEGIASASLVRVVPTCVASVIASAPGCSGGGSVAQLVATNDPWLGTIFVANASGLPTNSVGMTVLGLGTLSLPLPSLLPQGVAGCELLVTPDALGLLVPSGGQAVVPLPLPPVPALVGGVLHLQVVPIEFGVGGAITAVTSTNRLSLTLGIF